MSNPNFEYTLIVSDTETALFKATEEYGMSNQALYLEFDDLADSAMKERAAETMLAFAQNSQVTGYDLLDFYELESMTTNTEIRNYLQARRREIAEIKAKDAQQAQATALKQAAIQQDTILKTKKMDNEALDRRLAAEIESKEGLKQSEMAVEMLLSPQMQESQNQEQPTVQQ